MTSGPAAVPLFVRALLSAPPDPELALLFPGQGSQKVGMGRDLAGSFASTRSLYEEADRALGTPLSQVCFDGPEEDLLSTDNAQPAILITSLAYLAAALDTGTLNRRPAFLAGHSLGQYTALVAAGALPLSDALRLVRRRGQLMADAGRINPGGLLAVLGLDAATAEDVCRGCGAEPANFNSATQTVIGGTPDALSRATELIRERGGKALPVKVSGAFHTTLMAPAAAEFSADLDSAEIGDAAVPIVGNVTASPLSTSEAIRDDLKQQVGRPVRWLQTIDFMRSQGVRRFAEVGPGRVLTNMLKRDVPDAEIIPLDSLGAFTAPSNV